ncbi:SDR family NAD(P)-dependent oxidoreductase [Streptomyces griseorubiginosus]|uniref:SDR family NAD(P)-dependent oxidoreductase n=1 Tax=Streptomyces griseorubiginosus TaxID=67304 RepID=UPI0036436EB3
MTRFSTPLDARATAAEILTGTDLTGRHIIVSGASGLGATDRALAGAGATVTVATRRPEQARPLLHECPRTQVAALDLADLSSVGEFCRNWDGSVDAVVANAGAMMLPHRQVNTQGWEMQLATNYVGHFALLCGLRDALRASSNPRVVVVSSGAQLMAGFDFTDPHFEQRDYDPFSAYAQSKTAGALLAVGVSRRWADDGIAANAYKTPEQGAATAVLLAASPLVEGVNGRCFEDNQEATVIQGGLHLMERGIENLSGFVADWSVDPVAADALWDYALPEVEKAVRTRRRLYLGPTSA